VIGTGRSLLRRVLREHRRILVPLAIALVVNIAAYAFIVYPLSQRVANIAERDAAAERELTAARREHADATGTLTGKDRAAQELARFYMDVLPHDAPGARRLTHTRVPQLARQLGIVLDSVTASPPVRAQGSTLVRYTTRVELAGRYRDIRPFIHQLETAPEFVVIDNVSLAEEDEQTGLLNLTLQLSTYYKAAP
jgi:Tfp pilus assembly protein PilO